MVFMFTFLFPGSGVSAETNEGPDRLRMFRNIVIEAHEAAGDAICFNCSVMVRGQLGGDAIAIGGDVIVDGTVDGDALAVGGSVQTRPNSKVGGDLVALCGAAQIEPGSGVAGSIDSNPYFHLPGQRSVRPLGALVFGMVNFGMVLAMGHLIRPARSENLAATIRRHPWMTSLAGAIVMGLYFLLVVIADMLPRLEAPLIVLITLALFFLLVYGYVGGAWLVGRLLVGDGSRLMTWSAGGLALTFLFLIPIAGFLALILSLLLAPGSLILSGFGSDPDGLALRLRGLVRRTPWIDAA